MSFSYVQSRKPVGMAIAIVLVSFLTDTRLRAESESDSRSSDTVSFSSAIAAARRATRPVSSARASSDLRRIAGDLGDVVATLRRPNSQLTHADARESILSAERTLSLLNNSVITSDPAAREFASLVRTALQKTKKTMTETKMTRVGPSHLNEVAKAVSSAASAASHIFSKDEAAGVVAKAPTSRRSPRPRVKLSDVPIRPLAVGRGGPRGPRP